MRITQYLGGESQWGEISPDTIAKGLGGRETALVSLAIEWAKLGHEVINFVPVEQPTHLYYGQGRVSFVSNEITSFWLGNFPSDVLVSWEEARIFGAPEIRENVKLGIVEMQVAHIDYMSEELDELIDCYAVLSPWAGQFLCDQDPRINPRKIKVFPNGVDLGRFPKPRIDTSYGLSAKATDPMHFYYSSSPDRGLHHVVNMWPSIREMYPGAELHVAYGIEHWTSHAIWTHNMQCETALDVVEGLSQEGVVYHGRIGQDDLAKVQAASVGLLYPCDTMQPTETGCITVIEAGASLTPAFITDADCLGSEFGECASVTNLPFDQDVYLSELKRVISDEGEYVRLQLAGRKMAEQRAWPVIAQQWVDYFYGELDQQKIDRFVKEQVC